MKTFETIVVGTDFSSLGEVALASATELARNTQTKRLHVTHVVNSATAAAIFPYSVPEAQLAKALEDNVQAAQRRLDDMRLEMGPFDVTKKAVLGPPGRELAQEAGRAEADLVVAASHGYGPFRRTLIGSVTSTLIRTSPCPVLVVGEKRPVKLPFQNVLVAIDMSKISSPVLGHALKMVEAGGQVTVLSLFEHPMVTYDSTDVLPRYVSESEIDHMGAQHRAAVDNLVNQHPHDNIEVKVQVMSKAPAGQVILETSEIMQPDLLVVGTSGHNAWHRMIIGSTATRVISEAACPVLVVPHEVVPEAA